MILTPEQRNAVNCDSNISLEACPGSGKTRVIVAKLLRCIQDVRETPRKIAAITYTNAAVYEIQTRLRTYATSDDMDCCEVSTIHSFCLNNILSRFYWRVEGYETGFRLLAPETEEFQAIVQAICERFALQFSAVREEFERLSRGVDGQPILNVGSQLSPEVAAEFWCRLRDARAMDFSTLIYLSNKLLDEYPSLAHALSCRFKWILVDEFQDTTSLQVEILKKLHDDGNSNFFLVGDSHQSIFGFAGARPELVPEFAQYIDARDDLSLSMNWRSNPQIIAHAELLRPRNPPMVSAGEIAADNCRPQYLHQTNVTEALQDFFLPDLEALGIGFGHAAILAPDWFTLLPIGRFLRNYGVPIRGPGARPYRGSQIFARLAEYVCAYLEQANPKLIRSLQYELHRIIAEISGVENPDIFSYRGLVTIFRLIHVGRILRSRHVSAEVWLIRAAEEFGKILIDDNLISQSTINVFLLSANAICEQIRRNRDVDFANMTVSDLGLFAATDRSIQLLTMHAAKGLEFEAVAIVGLHDGKIPNRRAQTPAEIDESRRLFYVAITRAKRYLLYITDQGHPRNRPTRFLGPDGLNLLQAAVT